MNPPDKISFSKNHGEYLGISEPISPYLIKNIMFFFFLETVNLLAKNQNLSIFLLKYCWKKKTLQFHLPKRISLDKVCTR